MPKTILILVDDPLLQRDLAHSLAPFSRDLRVVAVADEGRARQEVDDGGAALLVVDLAASLLEGFSVAAHALRVLPETPILVLTRELAPTASIAHEPRIWMMRKPVDLNRFRERVLTLVDRSPQGHLTDFSLVGLLQLLNFEGRSAILDIDSPRGKGTLVVSRGELVDAESEGYRGEEAAHRVLTALARESCNIILGKVGPEVVRTIHTSLTSILLETARRHDDSARKVEGAAGA